MVVKRNMLLFSVIKIFFSVAFAAWMSHCSPVWDRNSGQCQNRNKKWTIYYRKSNDSDQKWMRMEREEKKTVMAKSFCLSVYFTSRYSEAWSSLDYYDHGEGSGNWGGVTAAVIALQWPLVYWEPACFLTAVCAGSRSEPSWSGLGRCKRHWASRLLGGLMAAYNFSHGVEGQDWTLTSGYSNRAQGNSTELCPDTMEGQVGG